MKKIGVIGLGNPLRKDDGIGIILLDKLIKKKDQLPDNIEFIDGGTGGMNLLHFLANFDKVIIIDAINFDGDFGESIFFKPENVIDHGIPVKFSTHESDFFKVLKLSAELKEIPDEIYIYGIQPKDLNFGQTLSTELQKKIDRYLTELQYKISSII